MSVPAPGSSYRGRYAPHTLQVTSTLQTFPTTNGFLRIKTGDSEGNVITCRCRQILYFACTTSRLNAARLRFCLVRNRFCNSSRMMRPTSSDKCPLLLPPPRVQEAGQSRDQLPPAPSSGSCRRERPSARADALAALYPRTSSAASG